MKRLSLRFLEWMGVKADKVRRKISSFDIWLEEKLEQERDQLPLWLPIAFGGGILLWFAIPDISGWLGCGCLLLALALAAWMWAGKKRAAKAVLIMAVAAFLGMVDISFRAYNVAPIKPRNWGVFDIRGQILQSEYQPSRKRMRLVIAVPVFQDGSLSPPPSSLSSKQASSWPPLSSLPQRFLPLLSRHPPQIQQPSSLLPRTLRLSQQASSLSSFLPSLSRPFTKTVRPYQASFAPFLFMAPVTPPSFVRPSPFASLSFLSLSERSPFRFSKEDSPARASLMRVRISVNDRFDFSGLEAGAKIAVRVKLTAPMPAQIPAGYDYAEIAWFQRISATGHALDQPVILEKPVLSGFSLIMASIHQRLTRHIIEKLGARSGGVAAAFVTNDIGSISESDTVAMRKAGLTHLLSVGGMHIGVVIAAVMFITIRLLALSPYLVLHFPLRMIAACNAALIGMLYTFVAGCEIPTVRSMLTAFFILFGMMIGRRAVSLRLVAAAAMLILLIQPENILSPSFQLSFAAVGTVIALAEAPIMSIFGDRREAGWLKKTALIIAEIIIGGVMVEAVVSPITLYHFHQSGFYGALANILAIPLTTFVTIPAEGLALLTDLIGCSAPFWWVTDQSIRLLLAIAHYVASLPMAGFMLPMIGAWLCLFMMAGWWWLGLWKTSWRLWGVVPLVLGVLMIILNPRPDWVISQDGKTIAFKTDNPKQPYQFIWPEKDSYSQDQIANLIGFDQEEEKRLFGTNLCQKGFCEIALAQQHYHLLAIKGKTAGLSPEECSQNDWVISSGYLPASCRPKRLKIDRCLLEKRGGLVFYGKSPFLRRPVMIASYSANDQHPWMRGMETRGCTKNLNRNG
ncbi:ComEC/Rec2 family competence protein [Zymomonas mobilis]|uniref:ComEC/Rec2 family competence protein n=1 Tax=Zymomonas mobilis TaxID=542 RepID=UPI0003C75476|nr:ComEC/Rec2 family competence protein [Zymomonas mobilis]AHB10535.1 ComEC/Rec2-related protein [Zymomonas mobilis subsp. mobilis str. CP4 = NRRL B-14023]AHJ70841.1 ComEC family competence protein [Zymomonas mobilis subsp. mobilis NRRL B-12526]AHJ72695.1 ComEC family competence protein [Zymomonas mobilis subsp. mobilis str. CP4 = NRRL B-14023]TWE24957.1 competence protein ComEC [Zymomonas mobilis]